jgi:hypothetical protein
MIMLSSGLELAAAGKKSPAGTFGGVFLCCFAKRSALISARWRAQQQE